MIFNEAVAQGFCCIQKLPPQSSGEFKVPGQEGAIWEGSQTASRPPSVTKSNTGEEGLCPRGEKESAFPTSHSNNKRHLACKYLTGCSEWWTVANETADNMTWSERARAEEREVKRLGNQIRMIKRNRQTLRMHLTDLWKTLRADIFLDNQITACLSLSHLEEGLDLCMFICLGRKRLQIDRTKKKIWKCHWDKGKQLSYFLPQCWPQPQASPQLCLQCWRAEVRTRSRPAAGGQSARSWEGVRSLVTSDSKAECKLKKFMKLFLLSEQIPDKWSANKAGKFSAVPAVGRMLACSEPGIYWMLLIAVTAHTRTQACLFTTCIIAVTTQMQISGLSQEQRDISKTQRPEGKLR